MKTVALGLSFFGHWGLCQKNEAWNSYVSISRTKSTGMNRHVLIYRFKEFDHLMGDGRTYLFSRFSLLLVLFLLVACEDID